MQAAQDSKAAAMKRADDAEAEVEHQVVRRVVEVAAMKAALNAKVCAYWCVFLSTKVCAYSECVFEYKGMCIIGVCVCV